MSKKLKVELTSDEVCYIAEMVMARAEVMASEETSEGEFIRGSMLLSNILSALEKAFQDVKLQSTKEDVQAESSQEP